MLLAAPQRPGRLPHGVRGGAAGLHAWRAAGADGVRQVPGQAVPLQRGAVDRAGDHREKRFPVITTDCFADAAAAWRHRPALQLHHHPARHPPQASHRGALAGRAILLMTSQQLFYSTTILSKVDKIEFSHFKTSS